MRKSTLFSFAACMAIAAGAFTTNAADQVAYTLTPAPGEATDLMEISINFTANKNVAFYENSNIPVAVLENTTTGAVYNCMDPDRNTFAQTDGVEYKLTFVNEDSDEALPITEPGSYTLTIRAFGLQDDNGDIDDLPVITANYTINYPVMYLLSPAAGSSVKSLTTVTLDFTDNRNVAFYENNRQPVAVLENLSSGVTYLCDEATRNTFAQTNGIAYEFNFIEEGESAPAEISAPGNYRLTVKALYLEDENGQVEKDLPVITADYTIAFPVDYTLNPAEGVATNLQNLSIEFAQRNVAFVDNMRPSVATLENITTGTVYNCVEADRNTFAQTEGIAYTLIFVGEDVDTTEEDYTPAAITEPGEYILTVRGMYLENEEGGIEEWLPVLTAKYTIEYPVAYYFMNPVGPVATNLKTVSILFPENRNVAYYEQVRPAVASLTNLNTGNEYQAKELDRDTFAETDGILYNMTFIGVDDEEAYDITEPGNYLLTIRGLYLEDGDGNVEEDLPVITQTFTINYPVEYILTPANGEVVQNLKTVSIEFPTTNSIEFFENMNMPVAVLVNESTGVTYNCQTADRNTYAMTEGIVYDFYFISEESETEEVEDITVAGDYTLTIRGLFDSNDDDQTALPVIYAHYTMGFPADYELDPISGATVDNLQTITLTFPNNTNVAFYENSQMPVAVLENLSLDKTFSCEQAERNTFAQIEGGVQYILNFIAEDAEEIAPIQEDGLYQLTVRALGFVNEEGEFVSDLPVITATYYVAASGVKAVEILGNEGNDLYNVYTINGIPVVRNGNAESVKGLGAGFYIINGKKVIIRN